MYCLIHYMPGAIADVFTYPLAYTVCPGSFIVCLAYACYVHCMSWGVHYMCCLKGHPFMTLTWKGRGSGLSGRMWMGKTSAPRRRPIKLEPADVELFHQYK